MLWSGVVECSNSLIISPARRPVAALNFHGFGFYHQSASVALSWDEFAIIPAELGAELCCCPQLPVKHLEAFGILLHPDSTCRAPGRLAQLRDQSRDQPGWPRHQGKLSLGTRGLLHQDWRETSSTFYIFHLSMLNEKKLHLPPQFQRFVAMPLTGELHPITIKWWTFNTTILIFHISTLEVESFFAMCQFLVLRPIGLVWEQIKSPCPLRQAEWRQ